LFLSLFSISFTRSWNSLRLSLSCNIFVRFGSVSCRRLSSLFVHDFIRDALLFVRYRIYIYRFLSGSSALVLLQMFHVPSGSGPFPALDRDPPLFCCEGLGIFCVSISLFLFRTNCYSIYRLGTLLVFFSVISCRFC